MFIPGLSSSSMRLILNRVCRVVRSHKAQIVKEAYEHHDHTFEVIVIDDICNADFSTALKGKRCHNISLNRSNDDFHEGVDGAVHAASPLPLNLHPPFWLYVYSTPLLQHFCAHLSIGCYRWKLEHTQTNRESRHHFV